MNKEKYLSELEKRLDHLTNEQKQQEIFRVSNELDNGSVMNDLSVEVNNIYQKYNINLDKIRKHENNKALKKIDNFTKGFDNFFKKLKKNDWKENLTILKDFIIIILIVSILKIPFIGLETLLFSIFENSLTDGMYSVFNFIIELIYVIFAIFMFLRLFKRRFKKEFE